MPDESIFLTIYTSEGVMFKDAVKIVSSANSVGKFDILPEHSNFISIVKDRITAVLSDGKTKQFPIIGNAIMRVLSNKVDVFIGVG